MEKVREQAQRARRARCRGARAHGARGGGTQARRRSRSSARARRSGARDSRDRGRPSSPLRCAHRSRDHRRLARQCRRGRPVHGACVRARHGCRTEGPADHARRRSSRRRTSSGSSSTRPRLLLTRALELAGESGSIRARAGASLSYGWFLAVKGELDAAETVFEEVRQTAAELGIEPTIAASLMRSGGVAVKRGDYRKGRRSSIERHCGSRRHAAIEGCCPICRRLSPKTLAALGKVDGGRASGTRRVQASSRPEDPHFDVTVKGAMAAVRAAQGRDEEAEDAVSRGSCRDEPRLRRSRARNPRAARRLLSGSRPRRRGCGLSVANRGARALGSRQGDRADRLTRLLVGRLRDHGRGPLEARKRVTERVRA